MNKKGLLAEDVAKELLKNPKAPVWCGAWNGHVSTYASVDHIFEFKYDQVCDDIFVTPGRIDRRLLLPQLKKDDKIFYIGSLFGRVPNPDVDEGSDNIDYPIKTINGEGGDSYLVWKSSGFINAEGDSVIWTKSGNGWEITYNTIDQILDANNYRDSKRFVGKVIGIETLRDIIRICDIDLNITV